MLYYIVITTKWSLSGQKSPLPETKRLKLGRIIGWFLINILLFIGFSLLLLLIDGWAVIVPLAISDLGQAYYNCKPFENIVDTLVANDTKGFPYVENVSMRTVLIVAIYSYQIIIINLYTDKLIVYNCYILYGIVGIAVDLSMAVYWYQSN
jgi:hypothetical protein